MSALVWQELGKPPTVNCQNNAIKIMHISTLQDNHILFSLLNCSIWSCIPNTKDLQLLCLIMLHKYMNLGVEYLSLCSELFLTYGTIFDVNWVYWKEILLIGSQFYAGATWHLSMQCEASLQKKPMSLVSASWHWSSWVVVTTPIFACRLNKNTSSIGYTFHLLLLYSPIILIA